MIEYDNLNGNYQVSLIDDRTIRKSAFLSDLESIEMIKGLCKHLIAHPDPMIVPVYSFRIDKMKPKIGGMCKYHYDMLRLGMLNENEKLLVDYFAYPDDYNKATRERVCANYPALKAFMDEVLRLGRYCDLHSGNFLKDEDGNYRIIDLEGFMHCPSTAPINDWFRKG